jgi:hypothetical protein
VNSIKLPGFLEFQNLDTEMLATGNCHFVDPNKAISVKVHSKVLNTFQSFASAIANAEWQNCVGFGLVSYSAPSIFLFLSFPYFIPKSNV